ncbi:TonB-dependent siderophore receptor [Methylosinus sp. Ce-a6]|uniref:TonB-dependent siderophore receptor n=1 Tax=Methylosinus sp. Ce-a6 TaxID=2172005 RepID=UPI001FCEA3B2|nr:TonB-dependent receptor [Methylosinus sp. Ce-a6]
MSEETRSDDDRNGRVERIEEEPRSRSGRAAPRSQDLGKAVSGVFVNSTSSNSGYSPSFVMRGFPAGLTLFDGAAHGFTSQDVDLSTVDHVEFFKGPSAMLFGRALGGYSGAANYIRKAPTDAAFLQGVATVGAFDVVRSTIDVNTPLNDARNLLFRVTGSAQTVGSFVDFVRARGFDIAPMLAYRADNGDKITLRAEHNANRLVYRDGVPASPIFLDIRREFYAGAPANEHESPFSDDLTFTYEHALDTNWKVAAVVDYFLSANRYGWFQGWGYDGLRSLTLGNPVRTRGATRSFDAQLRLDGHFATGSLSHAAFLGLEHWDYFFGHSDMIARNALLPIDIFAPIYPLGVDYAGANWANGTARAWSQSAYAQDLIELSPQWRILIGGRYDLLAQRELMFDPFGALSGEAVANVAKGVKGYFSPRAGLLFRPSEHTQLFAAFGQSLIPNASVRLKRGETPPPQRDTQYEIGCKHEFLDRKMSFELGLFDVTRDHVAIPDPANPSGFYSLVTGQQHSHGVEINVGGEILPNLRIAGVATLLHAVVTKDSDIPSQKGGDLLGAPRRVYSLSADYAFDSGVLKGLGLGASYYYASRAQATLPNTYGFQLAPQQMLGVSLSYSLHDRLKIEASATNLGNLPNFTSNGAFYRGEPRGFSVSLSYRH